MVTVVGYHRRGFEVVAISLDTKKSALESYVKSKNVPWVNLFEDGAGWKHPMAVKNGVSAIPTVFLVNRDGNVVSLRARGAELGKQLENSKMPTDTFVKSHDAEDSAPSVWGTGIRALLAYRTGDSKAAAEYANTVEKLRPIPMARAANLPVLAMAQHKLGDDDGANQTLEKALQVLESLRADDAKKTHHDLKIAEMLFNEAKSTINSF